MNEKNYEELFIFNRMAEGDKEAFRFFFERYYSDLCNLVNIYINDSVISEEIVQDMYIYFWEKKEKIAIESSVKSYLYRATKNKSLNYIRNEKVQLSIREKLSKVTEHSAELPDSIMDASQLREIIEQSINSLPEKCREVYILGKEKSLSYKEIAEELGISAKTVENQMGKALKKLRELLEPYYKDIFIFFLVFLTIS
ncbi:RNA polymerase sigma-70 factor [Mariniphaga sediminis]|jgi:RNA polymerase sigma-70 factor (ECF subfamily)|uniref:RNA polymerase sigma-70 factor n=1 Tax=Mariniphaga sediminis TaxID=1628158 RepID=A0A399DAP2_9BACT|nr:RNA polymerase sigma-70 factor [Mariniphaga sediminis]RIH67030.1 RNA polymerase sigma-70 factor [Mariniphaga sediminis]